MPGALDTTYLGLPLRSPIVAAASPATGSLDSLRRLAAAGVGAVVLPSVFQEQLIDEDDVDRTADHGLVPAAEAHARAVDLDGYNRGSADALLFVRAARAAAGVPVIASVNWAGGPAPTGFARAAELAGADALELNLQLEGGVDDAAADVEARALAAVREVRAAVAIPLAVKLPPYATSLAHLARSIVEAGADGLVVFHRLHGADVDLRTGALTPTIALSTPSELGLVVRWLATLRALLPSTSLGATGGVHDGAGAASALAAGADVVLIAAALLEHGPERAGTIGDELRAAAAGAGHASVAALRGAAGAGAGSARLGYLDAIQARAAALRRRG